MELYGNGINTKSLLWSHCIAAAAAEAHSKKKKKKVKNKKIKKVKNKFKNKNKNKKYKFKFKTELKRVTPKGKRKVCKYLCMRNSEFILEEKILFTTKGF